MPRYIAQHRYEAKRDGQQFGPWMPGTEVELREHDAQWVNRDSPGCLDEVREDLESARVVDVRLTEELVVPADADRAERPVDDSDGGGSAEDDVVPDGTSQVVLEWVAGDPDKAQRALEAELAKGDAARSTLVGALERIVAAGRDRMHRGGRNRAAG